MTPGERLRAEAAEERQAVKTVLDTAASLNLKAELDRLQSVEDIGEIKAALSLLASKITSSADLVRTATVVGGTASANIKEALADFYDYYSVTAGRNERISRREEVLNRNHAMRAAAARGDWEAFDNLAAGMPANGEKQDEPSLNTGPGT